MFLKLNCNLSNTLYMLIVINDNNLWVMQKHNRRMSKINYNTFFVSKYVS